MSSISGLLVPNKLDLYGNSIVVESIRTDELILGPIQALKGNILVGDGTSYTTLATGADTFVLVADSSQPEGVKWAAGGGGSGDVVGPGSSTDDAITRFDGISGTLLQNSTSTLTDAGLLTTAAMNLTGSGVNDILVHNGTSYVAKPVGTEGQLLSVTSGVPSWTSYVGAGSVVGFGNYRQTVGTQVITTTASKLLIDNTGPSSTSAYLPLQIRGISELWDTINNKLVGVNIGDGYTIRIDIEVTGKTASPSEIDVILDIGGGATPTIPIVERFVSVSKSPPYTISIGFPYFTLATFVTNGGQIFLATDSGTVTLAARGLNVHRLSSGLL